MDRVVVASRALRSVGYEPNHRMLDIEFVSGSIYRYFDVPDDLHAGLMAADSHGEFFSAHIRDAGFDYQEIA
ncbi:MAG: KTSC domain-containing protein [Luteimonas sp.]